MNRRERRAAKRQRRRHKADAAQAAQIVTPAVAAFAAAEQMSVALDDARDSLALIEEQGTDEQISRARRAVTEREAALVQHYDRIESYAASIEGMAP